MAESLVHFAKPRTIRKVYQSEERARAVKPIINPQVHFFYFWHGYGSIPINTIFRGMNIHLPAILMFTSMLGSLLLGVCFVPRVLVFQPLCQLAQRWNVALWHCSNQQRVVAKDQQKKSTRIIFLRPAHNIKNNYHYIFRRQKCRRVW